MTTESPMRLAERTAARKWHSANDGAVLGSSVNSMTAEELGFLLRGQNPLKDRRDMIPNRSGSAPPSVEGSFAAIGNLLAQQDTSLDSNLANLSTVIENCESEEQLRSDPAYLAYYCANVNLNPRLPPPLISRENQRLVRHISGFGNNVKLTSKDDRDTGSLQLPQGTLSTHEEEPEDDRSPITASDNQAEYGSAHGENSSRLLGRHKSLVDLIQEDFPRTPSPVYNQSRASNPATEESTDYDLNAISAHISSIDISKKPASNPGSIDGCNDTSTLDAHDVGAFSNNDLLEKSVKNLPIPAEMESSSVLQRDKSGIKDFAMKDDASTSGSVGLDVCKMESRKRATGATNKHNKEEEKQLYGRNLPPHNSVMQGNAAYQVQGVHGQVVSQESSYSHNALNQLSHGHPTFPVEGQPSLHPGGLTPPYYATSAAYMTSASPFYPNFQPYSPPYNLGGYAVGSSLVPQYMAGYPSQGAVPPSFDANPGPSGSGQAAGISMGESIPQSGDLQSINKFYGQHGLMLQPPYINPFLMQYSRHPYEEAYGSSGQHGRVALRGGIRNHGDSFVSPGVSAVSSHINDPMNQHSRNGSLAIPNPGNMRIATGDYHRGPSTVGFIAQYPAPPLASPVLPSSPAAGTIHPGWQNELSFPPSPNRNSVAYTGWQGRRGAYNFNEPKRHSFLEELRSGNSQKLELSAIAGHITEFSVDQHGSRFIQQKLECCSPEEKESVFREVLPHASKLMADVFGNYVIQKFFEYGSPDQRKELADQLSGQMLHLSLQMYGCRVIQKALEVIDLDQKTELVNELDGHVMKCVRDQNGNHVIQKCIECVPADKIKFIISAFRGHVAALSTHPYGCRVIQRVLEHCSDEQQTRCIVDEILESSYSLAQDQYGNYVTQHVLEKGTPHERSQIISKLKGKFIQLSQHKYASNVVEKCLVYGNASERDQLIDEIIGQSEENDHLLAMMKDQFANYVIQKILETCSQKQRETLLSCVRVHLNALKKYTYGKHIVARYEQLSGEDGQALGT